MNTRQMTYVFTALATLSPLAFAGTAAWALMLGYAVEGFVLAGFAAVFAVFAIRDIRRAWRRQWEHEATLRRLAQEARERMHARRDAR